MTTLRGLLSDISAVRRQCPNRAGRLRMAGAAPRVSAAGRRILPVLTAQQESILEFEDAYPRHHLRKTEDIRTEFGITAARYYQMLGELVRRPDVVARFPLVAGRVRRLDDERQGRRVARARIRREG